MRLKRLSAICAAPFAIVACLSSASAAVDLNGGVWRPVEPPEALTTLTGAKPPLRPATLKAAAKIKPPVLSAEVAHAKQCLPPGVPRILLKAAPLEFLQRPEEIVILYQWNRMARTVQMDIAQPEVIGPAYLGQSVGKWVGDTLRIETIGFNDATMLDEAGLPHSDQLRVVEEYKVTAPGSMEAIVTITDPKIFTHPWQTRLRFKHDPAGRISEDVCLERTSQGDRK